MIMYSIQSISSKSNKKIPSFISKLESILEKRASERQNDGYSRYLEEIEPNNLESESQDQENLDTSETNQIDKEADLSQAEQIDEEADLSQNEQIDEEADLSQNEQIDEEADLSQNEQIDEEANLSQAELVDEESNLSQENQIENEEVQNLDSLEKSELQDEELLKNNQVQDEEFSQDNQVQNEEFLENEDLQNEDVQNLNSLKNNEVETFESTNESQNNEVQSFTNNKTEIEQDLERSDDVISSKDMEDLSESNIGIKNIQNGNQDNLEQLEQEEIRGQNPTIESNQIESPKNEGSLSNLVEEFAHQAADVAAESYPIEHDNISGEGINMDIPQMNVQVNHNIQNQPYPVHPIPNTVSTNENTDEVPEELIDQILRSAARRRGGGYILDQDNDFSSRMSDDVPLSVQSQRIPVIGNMNSNPVSKVTTETKTSINPIDQSLDHHVIQHEIHENPLTGKTTHVLSGQSINIPQSNSMMKRRNPFDSLVGGLLGLLGRSQGAHDKHVNPQEVPVLITRNGANGFGGSNSAPSSVNPIIQMKNLFHFGKPNGSPQDFEDYSDDNLINIMNSLKDSNPHSSDSLGLNPLGEDLEGLHLGQDHMGDDLESVHMGQDHMSDNLENLNIGQDNLGNVLESLQMGQDHIGDDLEGLHLGQEHMGDDLESLHLGQEHMGDLSEGDEILYHNPNHDNSQMSNEHGGDDIINILGPSNRMRDSDDSDHLMSDNDQSTGEHKIPILEQDPLLVNHGQNNMDLNFNEDSVLQDHLSQMTPEELSRQKAVDDLLKELMGTTDFSSVQSKANPHPMMGENYTTSNMGISSIGNQDHSGGMNHTGISKSGGSFTDIDDLINHMQGSDLTLGVDQGKGSQNATDQYLMNVLNETGVNQEESTDDLSPSDLEFYKALKDDEEDIDINAHDSEIMNTHKMIGTNKLKLGEKSFTSHDEEDVKHQLNNPILQGKLVPNDSDDSDLQKNGKSGMNIMSHHKIMIGGSGSGLGDGTMRKHLDKGIRASKRLTPNDLGLDGGDMDSSSLMMLGGKGKNIKNFGQGLGEHISRFGDNIKKFRNSNGKPRSKSSKYGKYGNGGNINGSGGNMNGSGGNMYDYNGNLISQDGNMNGSGLNMNGSGLNMDGSGQNMDGSGLNINGSGLNIDGSSRNIDGSNRNIDGSGGNINRYNGNINGSGLNIDGSGGKMNGNNINKFGSRSSKFGDTQFPPNQMTNKNNRHKHTTHKNSSTVDTSDLTQVLSQLANVFGRRRHHHHHHHKKRRRGPNNISTNIHISQNGQITTDKTNTNSTTNSRTNNKTNKRFSEINKSSKITNLKRNKENKIVNIENVVHHIYRQPKRKQKINIRVTVKPMDGFKSSGPCEDNCEEEINKHIEEIMNLENTRSEPSDEDIEELVSDNVKDDKSASSHISEQNEDSLEMSSDKFDLEENDLSSEKIESVDENNSEKVDNEELSESTEENGNVDNRICLLYTSPSPRD